MSARDEFLKIAAEWFDRTSDPANGATEFRVRCTGWRTNQATGQVLAVQLTVETATAAAVLEQQCHGGLIVVPPPQKQQ